MESIWLDAEERIQFENELKAKGCVEIIKNSLNDKNITGAGKIEVVLNILFHYYCLLDIENEEITLEEKIHYLFFEKIIDEETKTKLLYLCEYVNNLYKLDEYTDA